MIQDIINLQGKVVSLSPEDYRIINDFRERTLNSTQANGRSIAKLSNNILSKRSELAFYKLGQKYGLNIPYPDFDNHPHGDGGIDFVYEGINLDVKETEVSWKKRMTLTDKNNYECDYFVSMLYHKDSSTFELNGVIPSNANFSRGISEGRSYKYCLLEEISAYTKTLIKS